MEEPKIETDLPIGKEEQASPPAPEAPANEQEPATDNIEQTADDASTPVADGSLHTPLSTSKAQTVFRDTQQLFQRLSVQARDAAVVAGQKLDQAALSLGAAVDNYATQLGNAYDQHVSKELAQAVETRERHRTIQETTIPPERQEQIIVNRSELVAQCLTLTGDIQQEIQYATKDNPLGRESYGLMMLCNVLVPILEHGLRQDWKSILPASTVLSSSSRWAQSLVKQARGYQPTAWDVLEAADQGWSDNSQVGAIGVSQLDLTGMQGGRRVQAWLYDSLNKGLLAGRIQALMLMSDLLEDWYFSWALLRTEGSLQDVLMELVKIESQEGLIDLPVEQLVNPAGTDTNMNGWTQKMRDTFHAMGGRAREASKLAYSKASESYSRVASAVRTPSTEASAGAMSTSDTPLPPPAAEESTAAADAQADAGYVDPEDDEDDEEGMIVHAGFGAPQKPLATTAVGGPVFLGLDGDSDGTKDEDEGEKDAPAESDEAIVQPPKPESS